MSLPDNLLTAGDDRERLRAWVFGLTMACPYDQTNPVDCPLCRIRVKPVAERMQWIDGIPDDKLQQIVTTHLLCLQQKQTRAGA